MESIKEMIEKRAYHLFLKRGGVHGYSVNDWFEAEKEIFAELEAKKKSEPAPAMKPAKAESPVSPAKPLTPATPSTPPAPAPPAAKPNVKPAAKVLKKGKSNTGLK
jgi:hypothetical protein